jgi:hypothetical protein
VCIPAAYSAHDDSEDDGWGRHNPGPLCQPAQAPVKHLAAVQGRVRPPPPPVNATLYRLRVSTKDNEDRSVDTPACPVRPPAADRRAPVQLLPAPRGAQSEGARARGGHQARRRAAVEVPRRGIRVCRPALWHLQGQGRGVVPAAERTGSTTTTTTTTNNNNNNMGTTRRGSRVGARRERRQEERGAAAGAAVR